MSARSRRESLAKRYGIGCAYCDKVITNLHGITEDGPTHPDALTLDHIIPLRRGGPNVLSNLCLACVECNQEKSDRTPPEWKPWVQWSDRFNVVGEGTPIYKVKTGPKHSGHGRGKPDVTARDMKNPFSDLSWCFTCERITPNSKCPMWHVRYWDQRRG